MAFFRLMVASQRRMLWRRTLAWREQSALMLTVIGLFVLAYGVGGYFLFRWGFLQLARFPGLGAVLVERVLYVLFAFLLVMLFFSNMIIGFASLFKSSETQWLLTLPVQAADVFVWKTAETAVLASWAFLFLSAPLMLAYGAARGVGGWFFVVAGILFVPFIVIAGALGAMVVLLVTRYLHRQVFKWLVLAAGGMVIISAAFLLRPMRPEQMEGLALMETVNQLLRGSQVALQPLLPSYWVAAGIVAWSDGPVWKGAFFLLVLVSNALMAGYVCVMLSRRVFYDGWSRAHTHETVTSGVGWLDRSFAPRPTRWLDAVLGALPVVRPWTRALIAKDIVVFWRDTAQWSQFVIFFGLLGLYVVNLRPSTYGSQLWTMFVAFLSLGATSLTLTTLTTRFVFPQFSLEGRRLWIVGLAPCGLRHVLYEKFWLSSALTAVVTLGLTLVSGWKLSLPGWMVMLFCATIVLMSFALSGIAVGIGALFPNFGSGASVMRRDDNPAKIVSGFGGTFCFVLSLVYIIVVLGAEAWPLYAYLGAGTWEWQRWLRIVLVVWGVVSLISLVAAIVPMRLALRRLESLEM